MRVGFLMSFCGLTAHFFLSLNNIPLYENVPLTAFFIIFFFSVQSPFQDHIVHAVVTSL